MDSEGHSILVFSINKLTATFDFVDAALSAFLKVKKGTPLIIIADTLRAEPVSIIEKKGKASAIAQCTRVGDTYENFLKESFKTKGVEIPIYRWKDLMNMESYKKLYLNCWEIAKKDSRALKSIEDLAMSHLKMRFPERVWKSNAITASMDFLMQETPLFSKITTLDGKEIRHVCYPTITESEVVDTLREIAKQANFFEGIEDVEYTQILISDLPEKEKPAID